MEDLLSEFYELVDIKIQDSWSNPTPESHLIGLSQGLAELCEKVLQIGTYAEEKSKEEDLSIDQRYDHSFIHYMWIREAKTFFNIKKDKFS